MNSNQKTAISIMAAFCALVCIFCTVAISAKDRQLQNTQTAANMNALDDLAQSAEQIRVSLADIRYQTASSLLIENTYRLSAAVATGKAALARLDISNLDGSGCENVSRFFSQAGEYALSLIKKNVSGASQEESRMLQTLCSYADALSETLSNCRMEIYSGRWSISDFAVLLNEQAGEIFAAADESSLFYDFPKLIYDGPYSDAETPGTYSTIQSSPIVSAEEIQNTLKAMVGDTAKTLRKEVRLDEEIAVQRYSCKNISAEVSVNGGYPLRMTRYVKVSKISMDAASAQAIAESYLLKLGFQDMVVSYYLISDGIINFRFVYQMKNAAGEPVRCYSDGITVGVMLDTGKISLFDAYDYMKNHRARDLSEPTVSFDEAAGAVSSELSIQTRAMAVIPQNQTEKYAYEFCAQNEEGKQYLIYVGTVSGEILDILTLNESDRGTIVS